MDYFTNTQKLLLRALSSNSRATVMELCKSAKCSRVTVAKQLKRLGQKLDIKYTIEVDETKLGASERHLIIVKLTERPSIKTLRAFFAKEKYAQQVYITEGDYDLLIYARASDPVSYIRWETYLASELSDYGATIWPSEFVVTHFGYFPLQDDFIEDIKEGGLNEKDKRILKILNRSSRTSYTDIAKATGMDKGTIRYRIFNLKKTGIIKRFTIAVQKPPKSYIISYLVNYNFNKTTLSRSALARHSYMTADDTLPMLNTFQILAPTSGSYRFFALALFENEKEAEERALLEHSRIFSKENVQIVHARVTKIVKGEFPFRNLDIKDNYVVIKWE